MALEGTLKDFSLTEIFQLLSYQQKSGVLTIKTNEEEIRVTFLKGAITSADSDTSPLDEELISHLMENQLLSQEKLREVLEIKKETLYPLPRILISSGIISPEKVKKLLDKLVKERLYKLFQLKEASFHFDPAEEEELKADYLPLLSAQAILMEAVQIVDELPIIEKKIPSPTLVVDKYPLSGIRVVETAEEGTFLGEEKPPLPEEGDKEGEIKLSPEVFRVYQAIDGKKNIKEIAFSLELSQFEASRAIYELLERKLVYLKWAKEAPIKEKKEVLPSRLGVSLIFITVLLVASFSLYLRREAPFYPFTIKEKPVSSLIEGDSYLRMKRIEKALAIYYFQHSRYPKDLFLLVREGLLPPRELRDAKGRLYIYKPRGGGYLLIGFDRSGKPSSTLTISHP